MPRCGLVTPALHYQPPLANPAEGKGGREESQPAALRAERLPVLKQLLDLNNPLGAARYDYY